MVITVFRDFDGGDWQEDTSTSEVTVVIPVRCFFPEFIKRCTAHQRSNTYKAQLIYSNCTESHLPIIRLDFRWMEKASLKMPSIQRSPGSNFYKCPTSAGSLAYANLALIASTLRY